ncbi:hypothetical protein JF540_12285 [Salipiger thiooxidans]|uniref:hypothetical protein n=1 Tax=Salipiger thiooxidans TaxID=282683 RepID=UPI001A8EEEB3|nr:hypothetical protein [Salipiger thiooxidans]MBN8187471.1 hypothetical protein [Salipiger thiooxidans]
MAPPWTGRVGDEVVYVGPAPAPPEFVSIKAGFDLFDGLHFFPGTGDPEAREISVLARPGNGSNALLTSYQIEHRYAGPNAWTVETVPISTGGVTITGYLTGEEVEIRMLALAVGGTPSAYSPTVSILVGEDDPAEPSSIDNEALRAEDGVGHAALAAIII